MTVIVTQALHQQELTIQNLMHLYTHDFSELWAETSKGDLLPNGRFEPYSLEEFSIHANWSAILIWRDRLLAGFALINDDVRAITKPIWRKIRTKRQHGDNAE